MQRVRVSSLPGQYRGRRCASQERNETTLGPASACRFARSGTEQLNSAEGSAILRLRLAIEDKLPVEHGKLEPHLFDSGSGRRAQASVVPSKLGSDKEIHTCCFTARLCERKQVRGRERDITRNGRRVARRRRLACRRRGDAATRTRDDSNRAGDSASLQQQRHPKHSTRVRSQRRRAKCVAMYARCNGNLLDLPDRQSAVEFPDPLDDR